MPQRVCSNLYVAACVPAWRANVSACVYVAVHDMPTEHIHTHARAYNAALLFAPPPATCLLKCDAAIAQNRARYAKLVGFLQAHAPHFRHAPKGIEAPVAPCAVCGHGVEGRASFALGSATGVYGRGVEGMAGFVLGSATTRLPDGLEYIKVVYTQSTGHSIISSRISGVSFFGGGGLAVGLAL